MESKRAFALLGSGAEVGAGWKIIFFSSPRSENTAVTILCLKKISRPVFAKGDAAKADRFFSNILAIARKAGNITASGDLVDMTG